MKKQYGFTMALAVLAAASVHATAGEMGVYLYGSYGKAESERKAETDKTVTGSGITAFTSTADESDAAYKLLAGYRLNEHLALEAGYVSLGKSSYRAASTAPVVATRSGEIQVDGWAVAGLMGAPFTETVSVFAKTGGYFYHVDFVCTGTGVACVNPTRTVDGRSVFYGLGLEWKPMGGLLVRAEYEIYPKIGEKFNSNGTTGTSRADVTLASVGVGFRF
jgi:opacity protein-like surface antigen